MIADILANHSIAIILNCAQKENGDFFFSGTFVLFARFFLLASETVLTVLILRILLELDLIVSSSEQCGDSYCSVSRVFKIEASSGELSASSFGKSA
jgi:hypothetical protein